MPKLVFAYPGDLQTPTGGYGYDRKIIAGLQAVGWDIETVSLGAGYPFPSEQTLNRAEERLKAFPENSLIVIDGLAFGAMPDAARCLSKSMRLIALVHHPLCQENGLAFERAEHLRESEKSALQFAEKIIVTSPATAVQVAELFDRPAEDITVIVPGTDIPEQAERPTSTTVKLLSVGTVVPRKGYDLLFKALSGIARKDWHLDVVGGTASDPEYVNEVRELAGQLNLSDRITFHGSLPEAELAGFYRGADIFVLASRYEGYGMAYSEAVAYGLPVIGSGAGAVQETLATGGALYCGVEDLDALQKALNQLISDPQKRQELAQSAREAAQKLPGWREAAAEFDKVLREMVT